MRYCFFFHEVQLSGGATSDVFAGPAGEEREDGVYVDKPAVAHAIDRQGDGATAERVKQPLLAFGQLACAAVQFELRHDLAAQRNQRLLLRRIQLARNTVHDTQRAERLPIAGEQGRAGVEADVRAAGDQRIAGETFILRRIGNDEQVGLKDGVPAKGDVAGKSAGGQADLRFEPLAPLIHQCNERDGCFAEAGRQGG